MRLRNLNRPHRRRKVDPRRHPIPDLVQIVPQIGLERLPDEPLRYVKRLVLQIRLAHSRPPRPCPVARATKPQMSQPLHSTPITGASSLLRAGPPARPHRYSTPHSFRCLAHSLSHPPPLRGASTVSAHAFPRFV